jgi:hypothetical protein
MNTAAVQEYRYVGFLRTNCFSKAVGLVKEEDIVSVELERTIQREVERKSVQDIVFRDRMTTDNYLVVWDAETNGGLFPTMTVKTLVEKGKLGDMGVKSIVYCVKSWKVVDILNEGIRDRAAEARKRTKDIVYLDRDAKLYAAFTNCHAEELKKLPYIAQLNKFEIDTYRFKVSCLDLTELHTERAVKYGEQENISVNDDGQLIREVLRSLDWTGWPPGRRTIEVGGVVTTPNPAAIRQYLMSGQKSWTLVGEKEVA